MEAKQGDVWSFTSVRRSQASSTTDEAGAKTNSVATASGRAFASNGIKCFSQDCTAPVTDVSLGSGPASLGMRMMMHVSGAMPSLYPSTLPLHFTPPRATCAPQVGTDIDGTAASAEATASGSKLSATTVRGPGRPPASLAGSCVFAHRLPLTLPPPACSPPPPGRYTQTRTSSTAVAYNRAGNLLAAATGRAGGVNLQARGNPSRTVADIQVRGWGGGPPVPHT